jgi:excisionase family DNA binding protein
MEELYSVKETARRLGGVTEWAVYAWFSQGKLRRTKVGSRSMVKKSDLEAFVAQCNETDRSPRTPR